MSECLGTDAILAIGDALDWDISEGLRHLETCGECRTRLEALRLTRLAFVETEPVDPALVRRISAAVNAAARTEKNRARQRQRWVGAVEPLVAGLTGLIVLVSSGIQIESTAAGLLGFALGATLIVGGRVLARSVPELGHAYADL
jgi:anti-sigma factor RsiW